MLSQLLTIQYNDPLWIAIAFICGLAVRLIGLPPLIGFLGAGFLLNALGAEGGEFLGAMANLGITLLLFSIGLKLKIKSLARPQVWAVASLHMGLITLFVAGIIMAISYTNLPLISSIQIETALLIAFALSFSSTVFAVKILDELGASGAGHGRIAIGVLVMQDIAAVVFMAISMGKVPSLMAFALVALIPLRFFFFKILDKVGHGELLILFGITVALLGAYSFELVGIKGDVGALVLGMLFANHPRANEMAKALLGFKELFLVGFFLSVGLTAMPGWTEVLIAILFIVILPIKVALYYGLFNLFSLRTSTSWRASLNLANYSEFGLIVGAIAFSTGWLPKEWLAVFAILMSISFMISAPLVNIRDSLYQRWSATLKRFERLNRLSGDENLALADIKVVVFGMGRMGTAAYDAMDVNYAGHLVGVEIEQVKATKLSEAGRHVVCGDATNPDFWERAPELLHGLEWALLTMPTHQANLSAALQLREIGYKGHIAATTKFHDQEDALKAVGVDHTFNIYKEAGLGFANELENFLSK